MAKIIRLKAPKSVASVIYLDVVNNYTLIQQVKLIFDDFVVLAVSAQNCAGKCAKSQVIFFCQGLRSPFFGRSFTSPLSITL